VYSLVQIQNANTCQNVFKIEFKLQIQQKYLKYTVYKIPQRLYFLDAVQNTQHIQYSLKYMYFNILPITGHGDFI